MQVWSSEAKLIDGLDTVPRSAAVAAALFEPLRPDIWVWNEELDKIGDCAVCLVGGTLRRCQLTNLMIQRTVSAANVDSGSGLAPPWQDRACTGGCRCLASGVSHDLSCAYLRTSVRGYMVTGRWSTATACAGARRGTSPRTRRSHDEDEETPQAWSCPAAYL